MGSGFKAKATALLSFAALSASLTAPVLAADIHAAGARDEVVAATGGSNPFADVPPNSWAYQAVQQLHADGLIEGYPDGYFKGKRPLTRYEIAVLTQRVEDKLEADLADTSKASKVNADDIALIKKLVDAYGADIASIKKQLATTKAETDANAKQLRQAHIHVGYILRPGIFTEKAEVRNLAGAQVPGQQVVTGTLYSPGTVNTTTDGTSSHGTGYQIIRLGLNGDIDDRTSYNVRLSNYYYFDTTRSTSGGSSVLAGAGQPNNGFFSSSSAGNTLGLDYANIQYKIGNGFNVTAGRFIAKDGPVGLLWSDYFNGVDLAYHKTNVDAEVGYSFNAAALSNPAGNPSIANNGAGSHSSQTVFAHAGYRFNDRVKAGLNYIVDTNSVYGAASFIGPAAGGYNVLAVQAPQSAGSINAEIKPFDKLTLQGEFARHFGKDPLTGNRYLQPNAFWGKAFYGNTSPLINHNYAEAGYVVSGVNGLSAHSGVFGQGDDYQQFYLNSLDGYHVAYVGAHHYFSDNSRIGLVYQRYALNAGVNLPAYNGAYVLSKDQGQALFLETVLQF